MSSSPASVNLFVSLAKILCLSCFVDLSASGRYRSEEYYNLSADKVCTWPVAPLGETKWLWRFSWYLIGSSTLYPLAKGAIQMLILLFIITDHPILYILLTSFWMTSRHDVFGQPRLFFFHGMVSSGTACWGYGPCSFVVNDQATEGGVS